MVSADIVVVDASLAVKWVVTEHDSELAHELLQHWSHGEVQLCGPSMLPAEVANAIHQRIRRDLLSIDSAAEAIDDFMMAGLDILDTTSLSPRALEIANQLGQGAVYDSYYLALAETLDCDFWTADAQFQRAARTTFNNIKLLSEFEPS